MCGIAGYVGDFPAELLPRMNRAQAHRGPDDQGVWTRGRVGLAHVRLAILDLSPTGHQPMADAQGRVILVFNGEIYNFRELRARLSREGVALRGSSDTEVLVELLARHGRRCLPWLNGIFALGAWFVDERRLLLARDGAGVKPLYWTRTSAGLAFASELKALLEVPEVDLAPDARAIVSYLSLLHAPGERTPARGVRKLRPGDFLECDESGAAVIGRFAPGHYREEVQAFPEATAIAACRHYLGQAVRRQLVSDVPLGGFLSGGVDSTSIAWHAVGGLPTAADYPCFTLGSVGGGDLGSEGFDDDLPYARLVSARLGAPLHVVRMASDRLDGIDELVRALDEPTPDPAAFATRAICAAARESGVKVLLSGAGGDDIFSGYRRHQALASERYWGWMPRPWREGLADLTDQLPRDNPMGRRLAKLFRHAGAPPAERLASYFLWLDDVALAPALAPGFREELRRFRTVDTLLDAMAALPAGVSRLNQMLHLDRSFFLADQNLNYTDKMAMACGVEVRVPFLDPDLVAFTERLPDDLKQRGRSGKYLLRAAMRGIVPAEVLDRPKAGFGFPLRRLLHGSYGRRLRALAAEGRLDATGVFHGAGVVALLDADARGEVDAAYPLMGVLCVESWLRQFAGR
jgi:asparagine synthase (glutamine-hydrolysing)